MKKKMDSLDKTMVSVALTWSYLAITYKYITRTENELFFLFTSAVVLIIFSWIVIESWYWIWKRIEGRRDK